MLVMNNKKNKAAIERQRETFAGASLIFDCIIIDFPLQRSFKSIVRKQSAPGYLQRFALCDASFSSSKKWNEFNFTSEMRNNAGQLIHGQCNEISKYEKSMT